MTDAWPNGMMRPEDERCEIGRNPPEPVGRRPVPTPPPPLPNETMTRGRMPQDDEKAITMLDLCKLIEAEDSDIIRVCRDRLSMTLGEPEKPEPACPDYGEPLYSEQRCKNDIKSRDGRYLGNLGSVADRAILCVNACQGITNEELERRIADANRHQQDEA